MARAGGVVGALEKDQVARLGLMFRHFGRLLPQTVGRGAVHVPAGLIEHPADVPGTVKTRFRRRAAPDVRGAEVLLGFFQHGGKLRVAERFRRHLVVDAYLARAVRAISHRHSAEQLGPVALGLLQDVVAVQIVPREHPAGHAVDPEIQQGDVQDPPLILHLHLIGVGVAGGGVGAGAGLGPGAYLDSLAQNQLVLLVKDALHGALHLAAGICLMDGRQHCGQLVGVVGDRVQIPGILVVVRVAGRDGCHLGPQSFFQGLVVGLRAQNILILGGVGCGPDCTHPARKEHRAGCDETKDHQDQQHQHAAHQEHVSVGGGKLRRFGRGGFGLPGGGAAGTVGRAATHLASGFSGVIAGLDLLPLLPAGDGVGCGLFGLFLPMQRPDVGFIGGFVQPFGLLVGFQFFAVLAVLQLPLVGGLHAGVFILVLLVHLTVCFAAQQRLRARLAALGLGDFLPKFRLAEAELR